MFGVLWIWLLLSEANGEDGVAKSEKRVFIKKESGPKGDSLVRSYVHTRVSRAFSSTSSFDDDKGGEEKYKSPDDRQSTIRIRNETVDLSKNTVPVLKYPGPTEPSLKDKYRRSTSPALTTPLKKSFKLKRNMTRPRPADLTTLLAFNALTPSPSSNVGLTTRSKLGLLPSTEITESMPPTAWALASLKGPAETTRKPGPPYVKPFVSWSTRLSKPTTTPSLITEILDAVTGSGESSASSEITAMDTTAEGIDNTELGAQMPSENSGPSSSTEAIKMTSVHNTSSSVESNFTNTENPQDINLYKPEENTISVPPLSSFKNISSDGVLEAEDILRNIESEKINTTSKPLESSTSFLNLTFSNFPVKNETAGSNSDNSKITFPSENIEPLEITGNHTINNSSPSESLPQDFPTNNETPGSNFDNSKIKFPSENKEHLESTGEPTINNSSFPESLPQPTDPPGMDFPVTITLDEHNLNSTILDRSDFNSTHEITGPESLILNDTEKTSTVNNSIFVDNEVNKNITAYNTEKESNFPNINEQPFSEETRMNETTVSLVPPTMEESEKIFHQVNKSTSKEPVHDLDPSINAINEKKIEEAHTTTTAASNSSLSLNVPSSTATPDNLNLTNLVEKGYQKTGNNVDLFKKLPLTSENIVPNTTQMTTTANSSRFEQHTFIGHPNSQQERHHEILNQTSNYIIPISKEKLPQFPFESNTENTSSTRSNEIKPDFVVPKPIGTNRSEINQNIHFDNTETTQSNYIQVQESIKPINITNVTLEDNSKKTHLETPLTITTVLPTSEHTTVLPTTNASLLNPGTKENITTENTPTTIPTTEGTEFPITITPPPMTTETLAVTMTIIPPIIEMKNATQQSLESPEEHNSTITLAASTTKPPTSTKSNNIKDQESELNTPIPEKNMTHFQYDTPNVAKNETTTMIVQGPDDIDDDDVDNSTYFADKKNPGDSININTGESDDVNEDSLHDILGNSSISVNSHNISNDIHIPVLPSSSSPTPSSTTTTSSTTDEFIPTQQDEETPNIDDDTIYDTGVVMPVYVKILFDANYGQLCREKDHLKDAVVKIFKKYSERSIDKRQVVLKNLGPRECSGLHEDMNDRHFPVHVMLTDARGQYDQALNDMFVSLVSQMHLEFKYPVMQVEKIMEQREPSIDTETQTSGTVVAAIVISSIAAICLFALTILLVIMRKRQSGFNYGQRCTPVSLDDYSLDNISVYNSTRRKAMRASKRSYGNPAFDDPDAISNPVNFAGLANMASDKSKTDEEFSSLPQVVVKPDELPVGAEAKNRYANVIPLPETRVPLRGGSPEEQFINANYVKGVKCSEKFYIACQAPLQNTVEDFWQMIWDEQSRLIIMLTALSENGVEKCADYLPPSEVLDCHRVFGDLQVTLKKREVREKYVIASLQLKNLETNLWREVTHMWYAGWPITGVPSEPSSVIAFLIEARSFAKGAPVVVHCSPGTGRTGTIIAIDIAIRDFEAGRSVDIPKTVVQIRRGRAGAVQTKEQYHFIYKVLHLYATKLTGGGLDSI